MIENKGVELQQFVTQALLSVVDGVRVAQAKLTTTTAGKPAIINPLGAFVNSDGVRVVAHGRPIDATLPVLMMSFDIAVSSERGASQGTSGEGGVDIKVLSSKIGTGYSKEEIEAVASRIRFEVPIVFPTE